MKKIQRISSVKEVEKRQNFVKKTVSHECDLYREPYREYCPECHTWVIALDGHCINNDSHLTSTFTPEERKSLFMKRNWEDGPEKIF